MSCYIVNMTTAFHNIPDYVSTESTLSPSVIESLASTCKCSFTTCNEKSISRCTQCSEYYCYTSCIRAYPFDRTLRNSKVKLSLF